MERKEVDIHQMLLIVAGILFFLIFLPSVFGLFVLVIALPFLLIAVLYGRFYNVYGKKRGRSWREEGADPAYDAFLKQLEGRNFFCYSRESETCEWVQSRVLPFIPKEIHVVYFQGGIPASEFNAGMMHKLIVWEAQNAEFPLAFKVRNGRVFCRSFREDFPDYNGEKGAIEIWRQRLEVFWQK